MSNLEKQVAVLVRLCTAEKETDRRRAREELRGMLNAPDALGPMDTEDMIRQVLLEVGAPDHLAGHPYVVQGVLLVLENWEYMNNVMSGLYPRLAELFDSTPSRIERSIRHVIEVAWSRGDLDVLERYFGNTVSASKGKPTNSEFMARVANIVRQRMKRAAADEACGIRAGVDIQ